MAQFSFTQLVVGALKNRAQLNTIFSDIQTALNSIDPTQISDATLQLLGLNDGAQVGRGKSIITTEETIAPGPTFTVMTTPDRVSNLILPTDGLLFIAYQGMWKESLNGSAQALMFLDEVPIKAAYVGALPVPSTPGPTTLTVSTSGDHYEPIATTPEGLRSNELGGTMIYTDDVTTGQVVGGGGSPRSWGTMTVFAAAGTYDVSVRFRTVAGGTITAKNRRLWVWSMSF